MSKTARSKADAKIVGNKASKSKQVDTGAKQADFGNGLNRGSPTKNVPQKGSATGNGSITKESANVTSQGSSSKPAEGKAKGIPVETTEEGEEGLAASSRRKKLRKVKPPHPLESLLGDLVVNAAGENVSPKTFAVENGVIALYFAAKWCPPCRSFCPNLMLLYDELHKLDHAFEVIFISLDNNETSFEEYLSKMPWYAIPFTDEDKREELAYQFGIQGIPVLVLIDAFTLDVISMNGRDVVIADPRGAFFPWKRFSEDSGFSAISASTTGGRPSAASSTFAAVKASYKTSMKRKSSVKNPTDAQMKQLAAQAPQTLSQVGSK